MSSFNIVLERERLERFDYSIRSEIDTFMEKLISMGILLDKRPDVSNGDEIVNSTDILKINILSEDNGLEYVNYKERYFNLTKTEDEQLIKDIIYYVFQDYLCDTVDYIGSVKVVEDYIDSDLSIDAEDLKKMDFKDFKDGKVTVDIDNYDLERDYWIHFLSVKEANGLTYEDGDSVCFSFFTLEQKKMQALWVMKRWFTMLVYGYYGPEYDHYRDQY